MKDSAGDLLDYKNNVTVQSKPQKCYASRRCGVSLYTIFPSQIVYFTFPYNSHPVNGELEDLEA